MRRKNNIITPVLALLLFVVSCNCNFSDWVKTEETRNDSNAERRQNTTQANSEQRQTDSNSANSGNTALNAEEKTGIAECDEFIVYIEQNSEEIGKDSIVVRGIVEYYKQGIYAKLKEGAANSSPADREDYAKQCRTALQKLKEQQQQQPNN